MSHYLINPTWRCHNRCSYCWLNLSIRQRPEMLHAAERPVEDWIAAIRRDKPTVVDVAGGEPFLLPWMGELVDACPQTAFGLSTNGLAIDHIRTFCQWRRGNVISVNVSYHPDTQMRAGYDRRWREAVLLFKDAGYNVHSNVVNYLDTAERSKAMLNWMKATGLNHEISPWEDVSKLAERQEQGLCCQGGVAHLTVAPDGEAWPCLSTLRSPLWKEARLGNWLDGTVDVARKPQPCHLWCHDYYVLAREHAAGDMWGVKARPCES